MTLQFTNNKSISNESYRWFSLYAVNTKKVSSGDSSVIWSTHRKGKSYRYLKLPRCQIVYIWRTSTLFARWIMVVRPWSMSPALRRPTEKRQTSRNVWEMKASHTTTGPATHSYIWHLLTTPTTPTHNTCWRGRFKSRVLVRVVGGLPALTAWKSRQ